MTLAQQHRYDTLAAGILLGGSVVATFFNYFLHQGFWRPDASRTSLFVLIAFQPLYLLQLYYISKGRRWAKILYLVLTGLGLIGLFFGYRHLAAKYLTSMGATFNFLSQQVIALTAAVLVAMTLGSPTPEPVDTEEEFY